MSGPMDQVGRNASSNTLAKTDQAVTGWISGWNPYDPSKLKHRDLQPVEVEESGIRRKAAWVFLLFFALFLFWAFTAPIDAGVSVQGNVVVVGNRKSVQHPSGGVIEAIYVKEGDEVKQGDVLLKVNPLKSEAEMTSVELQYINLLASEARLKAERDGLGVINWGLEMGKRFSSNDPRVAEAKGLQVQLFNSRRAEAVSQVASLNEQITGLNASLRSRQTQIRTLEEEMKSTNSLARDGFVPQSQANAAERQKSELDSSIANTQAEIARARLQISQVRTAVLKDVDTQLQEIQKNRDAVLGKLDATKFDRNLAQVRAPVSGNVVNLKVFTTGGVITSAQVLMEVVPKDETLAIDAKVPPQLIDKVNTGMLADMRFVAFNQDITPVIPGVVNVVGADKIVSANPQEGEYYMAQIKTTQEGLALLGSLKVQPGMPVDVVIKSGERSFMSYLLKPLSDKLAKAFKQ
jgi:protease secretion system membrane fusion protein